MHDLPNLRSMEAEGCRPDCKARLRVVRAWRSMEIYRPIQDMREAQPCVCGRDCCSGGVAGEEEVTE
jgi:hypothetical protein